MGDEVEPAVVARALGEPAQDAGHPANPAAPLEDHVGSAHAKAPGGQIPEIQQQWASVAAGELEAGHGALSVHGHHQISGVFALRGDRKPGGAEGWNHQAAVGVGGEPAEQPHPISS